MVRQVRGIISSDFISSNSDIIICHAVTSKGIIDTKLSRHLVNMFPSIYDQYKTKCKCMSYGIGRLGDVQFCEIDNTNKMIANIFYQYGNNEDDVYTMYKALKQAFLTIGKNYPNHTIRIPYKLGCDDCGGNWFIVAKIIETSLAHEGSNIEIWEM